MFVSLVAGVLYQKMTDLSSGFGKNIWFFQAAHHNSDGAMTLSEFSSDQPKNAGGSVADPRGFLGSITRRTQVGAPIRGKCESRGAGLVQEGYPQIQIARKGHPDQVGEQQISRVFPYGREGVEGQPDQQPQGRQNEKRGKVELRAEKE